MRFILSLFLWVFVCSSVNAGVHGHSTTFDPNSFGGNWTCFRSAASGTCPAGTTNQFFNAACDGVTSDETALAAWKSYGVSQGASPANLYIPPGSNCNLNTDPKLTFGIKKPTVWGYGASVFTNGVASSVWVGGGGIFARITASNSTLIWSGGTVTVTTTNPHGLTNPSTQIITVGGVTPSGYNGTFVATVTGASTFTYQTSNPGSETVAGNFTVEHSALINTASAGASTVTATPAGAGAIFSINDWICVSGLSLQQAGDPPNWQFFKYHQITNVSGDVLTLDAPLTYSYLSTWPTPGFFANGGPAMVSKMQPSWDTDVNIIGLTVKQAGAGAAFGGNAIGRNISLNYMQWFGGGPNISQTKTWTANNSELTDLSETDKLIDTVNLNYVTSQIMAGTNRSFLNLNINHSNFRGAGNAVNALNGTALNTTISNSSINGLRIGPQGAGWANNLTVTNTQFVSSSPDLFPLAISALSYNSGTGTFSIATASGSFATAVQWGCLNCQYYFAYSGAPSQRVADDAQIHHFTITAITGDATNFHYATDLVGALPTPTFGGQAADEIIVFPVNTVTQTNSGPDNLSVYAFP